MTPRRLEQHFRASGLSKKQAQIAVSEARRQGLTKEPGTLKQFIERFTTKRRSSAGC